MRVLMGHIVPNVQRGEAISVMGDVAGACETFASLVDEEDAAASASEAGGGGAAAVGTAAVAANPASDALLAENAAARASETGGTDASTALLGAITCVAMRNGAALVVEADEQGLRDALTSCVTTRKLPALFTKHLRAMRVLNIVKAVVTNVRLFNYVFALSSVFAHFYSAACSSIRLVCSQVFGASFCLALVSGSDATTPTSLIDMVPTKEDCWMLLGALDHFCEACALPDRLLDLLGPLRTEVKLALRAGVVRELALCASATKSAFTDARGKRMLMKVASVASASVSTLRTHVAAVTARLDTMQWDGVAPTNADVSTAFENTIAAALMPEQCRKSASSSSANAQQQTSTRGYHQVGKLANAVFEQLCKSYGGTAMEGMEME